MSQQQTTSAAAVIAADARLSFVLEFAKLDDEEKEQLISKYSVKSFDALAGKMDDLKRASYRFIDRKKQRTMWKNILWYQDYRRIYGKEPNWKDELTEDAMMDFETNDMRIPFPEGESLKHVFMVLHSNSNDLQIALADQGIRTFDDVIRHRESLEKGEFGEDSEFESIPPNVQKGLAQVADWFDHFVKENGRVPDIVDDLTPKVFEAFKDKFRFRYNFNAETFYKLTKLDVAEKNPSFDFLVTMDEGDRKVACEKIIEFCIKDVKENYMTPELHQRAPANVDKLMKYWVTNLVNFEKCDVFRTPYVMSAGTQSGKSATKAVISAIHRALGIPLFIFTKGNPESEELVNKKKMFAGEEHRDLVVGRKFLRKNKTNQAALKLVLEKGGTVVIADTKAQMEKCVAAVENHLQGKKFAVIVDEGELVHPWLSRRVQLLLRIDFYCATADSMYRTFDHSQAFEEAYDAFMLMRPCMRFFITATPVPVLLALTEDEEMDEIKFEDVEPCEDYLGVDQVVSSYMIPGSE